MFMLFIIVSENDSKEIVFKAGFVRMVVAIEKWQKLNKEKLWLNGVK